MPDSYTHNLLIWLSIRISVLAIPQDRYAIAHQRAPSRGRSNPAWLLPRLCIIQPLMQFQLKAMPFDEIFLTFGFTALQAQ